MNNPSRSDILELARADLLIAPGQGIKLERKDDTKLLLAGDRLTVEEAANVFDPETKTMSKELQYTEFNLNNLIGFKYVVFAEPAAGYLQPVQEAADDNPRASVSVG